MASVPLCEHAVRSKGQSHFVHAKSGPGRPCSYKSWSDDGLERACDAVRKGMSVRRAAEEYAIPRSTLHDHISGPKATEEDELVNVLIGMTSVGYSKDVIEIVQGIVDNKGLEVTVSPSWWKSFRSRHKDLRLRNPEALTHSRMLGASETMIEHYFELLYSRKFEYFFSGLH